VLGHLPAIDQTPGLQGNLGLTQGLLGTPGHLVGQGCQLLFRLGQQFLAFAAALFRQQGVIASNQAFLGIRGGGDFRQIDAVK